MPIRNSAVLWLILALIASLGLSGCNGCRPSPLVNRDDKKAPDIDELEKKKKEKEKPKEDFQLKMPIVIPGSDEDSRAFVKPGHWSTVRHLVKANNFDFQAELHTRVTDSNGQTIEVENTPFQVSTSRPAPLPKGQDKSFDTNYFIPEVKQAADSLSPRTAWLFRELRAARGGRTVKEDVRHGTMPMPGYQYHFIVLANDPDRYGFLKSLPSFSAPTSYELDGEKLNYYRVTAPKLDRVAPLPNHALTWTSIAYILWDDVNPQVLTPAQQTALVDWLHFGGQLIISGPNSLDLLRGTYLDAYLPAKPGATMEATQSALDEINGYWSLTDQKTREKRTLNVLPGKPLSVISLPKHADARFVPHTGELVVERRVGSGRIVATAFALSDSRILNWGSLDGFVNGAILRRPRRVYQAGDLMPNTLFADYHPSMAMDPRLITTLRFFSRDMSSFSAAGGRVRPVAPEQAKAPEGFIKAVEQSRRQPYARFPGLAIEQRESKPDSPADYHPDDDDWHLRGYWPWWSTGVAAWNDKSGAADAACQALKDAAGISIPKGEFVLKVIAFYLLVLAPLNWLVFRLMGRVEWAWIAAPIIAIIGTFAVVRLAQLDIGFARSMTEIAIAEVHGDYPRAHVTRFTALYTSLSTSYDFEFADEGTLAMPFGASLNYQRPLHDPVYNVTMRRDRQLHLSGFLVSSNKTGIVHCEQLADLGGAFSLIGNDSAGWQLKNGTKANLKAVGVLRRQLNGRLETAWIGDLRAKTTTPLKFTLAETNVPGFTQWSETSTTLSYTLQTRDLLNGFDRNSDGKLSRRELRDDAKLRDEFLQFDANGDGEWADDELTRWSRVSRAGEVSLGQLWELGTQALRLLPGEARLLGWTSDAMPGVAILPKASQEVRRTMFLVHLRSGVLPEPKADVNLLSDVQEITPENETETTLP